MEESGRLPGRRCFQGSQDRFLILQAGQGEEKPHEELGRAALTLLMLQKIRRSSNQKKTAMTPVPTRIMISMLPLSWEPAWAERRV